MIIKSNIVKSVLDSEFPGWKNTGEVPVGYTYDTLTCFIQNYYSGRYEITKQDVYGVLYVVRNKINKNEFRNAVVDVEVPRKVKMEKVDVNVKMKKIDVIKGYLNKHYPTWIESGSIDSNKTYMEIHRDMVRETGRLDISYGLLYVLLSNTRKKLIKFREDAKITGDSYKKVVSETASSVVIRDVPNNSNNVIPIGIRQNNNHVIEGFRMSVLGLDLEDMKKIMEISFDRITDLKMYAKEISANG